MRRLILLGLLACLAAPAAAWAAASAPGDGTLAVRNGDGLLTLVVRDGVVIGKLDSGVLDVASAEIEDCSELNVWGADRAGTRTRDSDGATVCTFRKFLVGGTSEALRFRLVMKRATLYIRRGSTGFSLSAIGRGWGYVEGAGGFDGVFSVNGDTFSSLPDRGERFTLGATLP